MLFRRQSPQKQSKSRTLADHAKTVETILAKLKVDPAQAKLKTVEGYGWSFRRGSAIIEIYVTEHEGQGYFQVLAPILHLPTIGLLQLYRHLLELNLQMTAASLGVYHDVVYVFSERLITGLDFNEANSIITLVAGYADTFDNQLVTEFGGRLYGQA